MARAIVTESSAAAITRGCGIRARQVVQVRSARPYRRLNFFIL
jgi:hypothetical protein